MKIFRSNPFAQYSAEEEKNILEDIFYEPKYYRSLLSILSMNSSRFLLYNENPAIVAGFRKGRSMSGNLPNTV